MSVCAEHVKEFMNAKGLAYHERMDINGNTIIKIEIDKLAAHFHFTGEKGEYLSLDIFFETVPNNKVTDMIFLCNELNKNNKWITAFVSDNSELVFHDDAILLPEHAAMETMEIWARIIQIISDAKPQIMKTLTA